MLPSDTIRRLLTTELEIKESEKEIRIDPERLLLKLSFTHLNEIAKIDDLRKSILERK